MFESARSVLELDEEQLGAMDGILSRVLGDETVLRRARQRRRSWRCCGAADT